MTDQGLIARLREADDLGDSGLAMVLCAHAADRIEKLLELNKELALQLLAAHGQAADVLDKAVVAEAKLAKAVKALQYANEMVRLDLLHMTDWDHKDFSQAVVDTGKRIAATLAELEGK